MLVTDPLDYLIGAGDEVLLDRVWGRVTSVAYGVGRPRVGDAVAYCNALAEQGEPARYGPYLRRPRGSTATQYNEGVPNPRGRGWERNLRDQFEMRVMQGHDKIEIDNPDAFSIETVVRAMDLAAEHDLWIFAKNPMLGNPTRDGGEDVEFSEEKAVLVLRHPRVVGSIVERGCGDPVGMDRLRRLVGKPMLPIRFVCFDLGASGGPGLRWGTDVASAARRLVNVGVTYSGHAEEYGASRDLQLPVNN